jgi:hypothetical protein
MSATFVLAGEELAGSYLGEQVHADENLYEIIRNQCMLELVWFAIFHEAWPPRVDKVKVEPDDGQPRHRGFDQRPLICPRI